jgi:hypothetical protein
MTISILETKTTLEDLHRIAYEEYKLKHPDWSYGKLPDANIKIIVTSVDGVPVTLGPYHSCQVAIDVIWLYLRRASKVEFTVIVPEVV